MEGCLIVRVPVRNWEKRSAYIDKVTLQPKKTGGGGQLYSLMCTKDRMSRSF